MTMVVWWGYQIIERQNPSSLREQDWKEKRERKINSKLPRQNRT